MKDLVCHADYTSFYTAFVGAGIMAVIVTGIFLKKLDRIRAWVKLGRAVRQARLNSTF
jgi:hypothetical protein